MFVGIRDAPVVLFLELVLDGVGSGVAAEPELLDELFAFLVGGELFEGFALFIGDDVGDIRVEPLLPGRLEFFFERGLFLAALPFGERFGYGFAFLIGSGGLLLGDLRGDDEKKSQAD